MADGLRWQEVFRGAEENLMSEKNGKVTDAAALNKSYWRATPEERHLALMPCCGMLSLRKARSLVIETSVLD